MARRLINGRLRTIEQPGVVDISRLLVVGFLIAGLLGLVTGVAWVDWHLLARIVG